MSFSADRACARWCGTQRTERLLAEHSPEGRLCWRRETGPRVWGGMSPGTGIPGVKVTTLSTILWGQGPAFSYCLRGIDEQHIHLQAGRAEAEKLSLPDYRVTTSVSKRQQPERVGRQT